ncbi:uncharacterized protein LACBIDRAFT_332053 [Laccaria bicolor S238N-H82]|uniref:Predicted protein n=1 Tax=Laccaria bicolor (strain S238N-H82 / ATCC MYA-4686) TaxID=486041 RepID=B0DRF2_LACBS|nr:uncharacterized protein LACBIDRAFT_332053 [Laccaria bicolor S238N-H82]EDR02862.1 predicted protein [Laccaria bicolor S238N-H82]|eukprot:XP_001886572.1 predicted protein [Laccaria bicolor S238N-H82]
MSGLLSLPTELLQEIGAEVSWVGGRQDSPFSPLWPSSHQNGVTSLEEVKIRSFLLPAIGSLVGVRQILWELDSDPEWATLLVLDALASLPVLEDLHLRVLWHLNFPVPFQRLSNLKKLTLNSCCNNRTSVIRTVAGLIGRNQPELTSLIIVDTSYGGHALTLQDFLAETSSVCLKITHLHLNGLLVKFDASALRHLRSLISLTIADMGPESLAQKIWSTLRSEKIHLQELVTDDVQPALVEYLTSFSGLRRLRLIWTSSYRTPLLVSNQLAIRFYEQGLDNHISFLESLQVRSSYEGKWCFGNHCSNVIKRGTRLTLLKLSINSEDIPRGEEEVRDYAESPSPIRENAIWSLLDICATLPILKSLTMRSVLSEHSRGNGANMQGAMRVWIAQNLESYGPITPNHVFHVSTPGSGTEYAVRRDNLVFAFVFFFLRRFGLDLATLQSRGGYVSRCYLLILIDHAPPEAPTTSFSTTTSNLPDTTLGRFRSRKMSSSASLLHRFYTMFKRRGPDLANHSNEWNIPLPPDPMFHIIDTYLATSTIKRRGPDLANHSNEWNIPLPPDLMYHIIDTYLATSTIMALCAAFPVLWSYCHPHTYQHITVYIYEGRLPEKLFIRIQLSQCPPALGNSISLSNLDDFGYAGAEKAHGVLSLVSDLTHDLTSISLHIGVRWDELDKYVKLYVFALLQRSGLRSVTLNKCDIPVNRLRVLNNLQTLDVVLELEIDGEDGYIDLDLGILTDLRQITISIKLTYFFEQTMYENSGTYFSVMPFRWVRYVLASCNKRNTVEKIVLIMSTVGHRFEDLRQCDWLSVDKIFEREGTWMSLKEVLVVNCDVNKNCNYRELRPDQLEYIEAIPTPSLQARGVIKWCRGSQNTRFWAGGSASRWLCYCGGGGGAVEGEIGFSRARTCELVLQFSSVMMNLSEANHSTVILIEVRNFLMHLLCVPEVDGNFNVQRSTPIYLVSLQRPAAEYEHLLDDEIKYLRGAKQGWNRVIRSTR